VDTAARIELENRFVGNLVIVLARRIGFENPPLKFANSARGF